MSIAMERSQQQQRPRSKSTFSFKSDKSHASPPKHERHDSHNDKNKPHLHPTTKADPNAAMNESQPIAAALEQPTLQSLRSFQHTDVNGNPIAEPDLSNPTRSRWERPLDTIRSFEAAIDNEYRRRAQTMRPESSADVMSGYGSRRSSYYGGSDHNRFSQVSGYYGSRQAARDSWIDNGHGMGGPVGGPVGGPSRTRYNRMQYEAGWNRYSNGYSNGNVYPSQGYQQSRDTVNTHGSNGSQSDPYSNDPSSDNSSIERVTPVKQPDLGEQYGFQGFGGGPILEEYTPETGRPNNGYFQPHANGVNGYGVSPPVPAKTGPPPPAHNSVKPSKSQGTPPVNSIGTPEVSRQSSENKRKSWFKRRFSKG